MGKIIIAILIWFFSAIAIGIFTDYEMLAVGMAFSVFILVFVGAGIFMLKQAISTLLLLSASNEALNE